jgi:hypothetical protein
MGGAQLNKKSMNGKSVDPRMFSLTPDFNLVASEYRRHIIFRLSLCKNMSKSVKIRCSRAETRQNNYSVTGALRTNLDLQVANIDDLALHHRLSTKLLGRARNQNGQSQAQEPFH